MNVAALLQDSPSDERRRNGSIGSNNSGNYSNNSNSNQQALLSNNRDTNWASTQNQNWQQSSGGWKDGREARRNSPGLASRGRSGSSPQMQPIIQGAGQGMGIGHTRNPSRPTHNPTLSQPTPPQQASPLSPLLPPASSLPRGGVWGPAPGHPPGPDSRGEQSRIPDSTALPRRDYMDRERDRERDQPRILNIMDWQGERPRSDDGRRRPHPGGPGDLRDSQSPVMPSMSRLSSSGSAPIEDSVQENDGDYIRSVRRHRSSRSGSAPTDSIKSSGPIPPRGGDFPYQPFQPPSHFATGLPIPAPIPAPAPGTLALVPPQHQHSHQQHQLAQAQAQQQQIHVNAQGPTVLLGPTASVVGPPGGSTMSIMEPRGGTIVNLNGPTPPNPPQKQFQNQFHTQFLPGLQLGPPGPGERRERDPSRDRDWERDERDMDYPHIHHPHSTQNSRRGSPLPGSRVELTMGMGMGVLVPDRERERDIDHRHRHSSSLPSGPSRRHLGSGHPSAMGGFGREKELRERERERDRDFRERDFRERDRETGYRLIGSGPGPELNQLHSHPRGDPRDAYHHLERERMDRERERERDRIDRDRERADAFHRDRERERDREQRERERSMSISMMGLGVGDRDRERERDLIRDRERTRLALIGDVSPPGPNMSMDDVHVYGMNDPYMPPHVADPRGYNPNHNNTNNSLPIGPAMGLGPMISDGSEELPEREVKSRVKIELGSYVWPKSPFPYFFGESKWSPDGGRTQRGSNKENESAGEGKNGDKMDVDGAKQPVVINLDEPPSSDSKDGDSDKDLLDSETLVTIVIPNGFIPPEKPKPGARKKYRIWGGGVVSPLGGSTSSEAVDGIGYREHEQMRGLKSQPLVPSHQQKASLESSNNPAAHSTSSKKPLRRRRIYTDDSDIFLCAIHSGWVSWSGAKKAREEGKDLKLRLRVIRCLGVREDVLISAEGTAYSLSASGLARRPGFLGTNGPWVQLIGTKSPSSSPGKGLAINGLGAGSDANADSYMRSTRGKEEVVARFMGGMGEKYFGGDIKIKVKSSVEVNAVEKPVEKEKEGKILQESKPEEGELKEEGELDSDLPPEPEVAKIEPPKVEEEEEPVPDGGPEDDGRSLLSAGWGIGHDGSGIEVVDAEFISRQITRSGIRNRSQRLLEYAERRANIFSNDHAKAKKLGPFVTNSIAGRKRSRGIFEASYPSHTHISRWDLGSRRQPNAVSLEAIIEEDESGGSIPIVLSNDESGEEKKTSQGRTLVFGRGAEPWYKYTPEALRAAFSADGDDLAERPTKRKKIDAEESTTPPPSQSSLLLKWDDSDRCCLIRTQSIDLESPKSTRFALFITHQSRVKDHLSYRFPESIPKPSGDVVMNGVESESVTSPMEVVAAISAASVSPLRQLNVDDWVVRSHCVYTSEEDVWLLGLDSMQFVDAGININRTKTIPVTRWKFVSVS